MTKNEEILHSISAYEVELKNIRFFLREKRTISEWQDWLWRRVSKFTGETTKFRPSTRVLGRWEGGKDRAVLYTDLLTCLCAAGAVIRERLPHTTTYKWVDNAADTR